MNEPIVPLPPRESILRHRKERRWQIFAPILIAAILGITLAIIIVYGAMQGGDTAIWAAIATILLVLPIMIVSFILLVVLSVFIYEAHYVYKILPTYSGQAQDAVFNVTTQVVYYAEKSTEPLLFLKTWLSVPGKIFRKE
jgi:predicted PurR-regulated permease PerM